MASRRADVSDTVSSISHSVRWVTPTVLIEESAENERPITLESVELDDTESVESLMAEEMDDGVSGDEPRVS